MSDSDPQVIEKKKSSAAPVLFLVILLAGLTGIWVYQKQGLVERHADFPAAADETNENVTGNVEKLDIENLSTPRILGNKNAPLKITEHSSFSCGACAKYHSSNFKKIKTDYIDTGKAFLVYDDLPRNAKDLTIGAIARCVPEEAYFKFIQLIFATQSDWNGSSDYLDQIKSNAVMVGGDATEIEKCAASTALKETLAMRKKNAQDKHGVNQTPTLIIDDSVKVSGLDPYHEIQKVINDKIGEIESDQVIQPENIPEPIETAAGEPAQEEKQTTADVKESSSEEFDLKKAKKPRILGDVNAPIQIIEHSSFSCPHCADFHHNNFPKLKADYIDTGKAYLIFDDFPLSQPDIMIGALARCVADESYFNFVQFVFENQEEWRKVPKYLDYLKQNARLTGASDEHLQKCLDSRELHEAIAVRGRNAYERKKVSGTPTLIINDGHPVSALVPYSELQGLLDKELKKEAQ